MCHPVLDADKPNSEPKEQISSLQGLQCREGSYMDQIIPPVNVNYTEVEAMEEWVWCYANVC